MREDHEEENRILDQSMTELCDYFRKLKTDDLDGDTIVLRPDEEDVEAMLFEKVENAIKSGASLKKKNEKNESPLDILAAFVNKKRLEEGNIIYNFYDKLTFIALIDDALSSLAQLDASEKRVVGEQQLNLFLLEYRKNTMDLNVIKPFDDEDEEDEEEAITSSLEDFVEDEEDEEDVVVEASSLENLDEEAGVDKVVNEEADEGFVENEEDFYELKGHEKSKTFSNQLKNLRESLHKDVINILDKCKTLPVISRPAYTICRIFVRLLDETLPPKVRVYSGSIAPQLFTFFDGSWYALPGEDKKDVHKYLLTKLLYRAQRRDWDDANCKLLHCLLDKVTEGEYHLNLDQEALRLKLEELEQREDYYAEDFSEDSDDEAIEDFKLKTRGERASLNRYADDMMRRGYISSFFTQKKELKTSRYAPSEALKNWGLNIEKRAEVVHDEEVLSAEIINDLHELNDLIRQGKLDLNRSLASLEEELKGIATKFFIAQYRGIHYDTQNWNADARRAHRIHDESITAHYSRAVYALAELEETRDFDKVDQSKEILEEKATLLQHQLVSLSQFGPFTRGTQKIPYTYDNPFLAVQDFYTKDYAEYHKKLKMVAEKRKQGENLVDPFEMAFSFSYSSKTPLLSTGDTPYHALKYAYGIKYYENQLQNRLRPRWHKTGQAERPYSGKVYTFLLSPADYFALNPNHLISLNYMGKVQVDNQTIAERETTFSSYIPMGKLIHQHVARYPGFQREEYGESFKLKYGLDNTMYAKYREKILNSTPHSDTRTFYKHVLGEHLCAYHEASLVEDARLAARERGGWLIYRDSHGFFSLVPPRIVPKNHEKDADKKEAARRQQKGINEQRNRRRNPGLATNSALTFDQLCEQYEIQVGKDLVHLLGLITGSTEETIRQLRQENESNTSSSAIPNIRHNPPPIVIFNFCKNYQLLQRLANKSNMEFELIGPLFEVDLPIQIKPEHLVAQDAELKKYKLLYLGGDCFACLHPKNSTSTPSKERIDKEDEEVLADGENDLPPLQKPVVNVEDEESEGEKEKERENDRPRYMDERAGSLNRKRNQSTLRMDKATSEPPSTKKTKVTHFFPILPSPRNVRSFSSASQTTNSLPSQENLHNNITNSSRRPATGGRNE